MASVVIMKHTYRERGTKRINGELLLPEFDDTDDYMIIVTVLESTSPRNKELSHD